MIQKITCMRCGQFKVIKSHLCAPKLKFKAGDLVTGGAGRLDVLSVSIVEGRVVYDVRTPGTRGTPWAYPVKELEKLCKRVGGPRRERL
jgi:hypothetical protein